MNLPVSASGNLAYKAAPNQVSLLLSSNTCEPVCSRSGLLCYLKMRRNPPARGFITTAAQDKFTVSREAVHGNDRTGIVYRHNGNGQRRPS